MLDDLDPPEDLSWNAPHDDSPFTDTARAQVALAYTARDLSDSARSLVSARLRPDVSDVEHADRLVRRAESVLRQAVVVAREAGHSWADIGESLGVTKQSAQERFGPQVEAWRRALDRCGRRPQDAEPGRLPYGAGLHDTARVAADLDAWAVRHREPTNHVSREHPDRPVSGYLAKMTAHDEMFHVGRLRRAAMDKEIWPAAELLPLFEREAELWDRMATGGSDPAGAREAAESARALAQRCRDSLTSGPAGKTEA